MSTITPPPFPLPSSSLPDYWVSKQSLESSISCRSARSVSSVSRHSTGHLSASVTETLSTSNALPAAVIYSASTTIPITVSHSPSIILSSTISVFAATTSSRSDPSSTSTTSVGPSAAPEAMDNTVTGATCVGHGLDTSGEGVLASAVITSLVGLLIWIIFAFLRPRIPQFYAVREWFVNPQIRPEALGSGFFSFLHPPVPLRPSLTEDDPDTGRPLADDAVQFPSDEQLSQRTLWIAFLIALGWTFLGLVAFLPLYLTSTPCLANSSPSLSQGSAYSTLADLSVLRLVKMVQNNDLTNGLSQSQHQRKRRAIINGVDEAPPARARLIILSVLLIILMILPALWKLVKEFERLVAYRKRWLEGKCAGLEMGWLSLLEAPGFVGWNEGRMKEFIGKSGLGTSLEKQKPKKGRRRGGAGGWFTREPSDMNVNMTSHWSEEDRERAEAIVDIQAVYTVPDTQRLKELIDERDAVLNELEEAETNYIHCFQLATPPNTRHHSGDMEEEEQAAIQNGSRRKKRRMSAPRSRNSPNRTPPTSYLAPKSYYKLGDVPHISGGKIVSQESLQDATETLSQEFRRGVTGSKFQEVTGDNVRFGSIVHMNSRGELVPTGLHAGPNSVGPEEEITDEFGQPREDHDHEKPEGGESGGGPEPFPTTRASSFVMIGRHDGDSDPNIPRPGHNPGVRPITGHDLTLLPTSYQAIKQARTRLKALNAQVNDMQQETFNDIADGTRIKGWILIGRGIRFVPGIEMIEGRSKEDIRWDELQNERKKRMSDLLWWILVALVGLCLAASFIFAVGLAYAGAPNFASQVSFLRPLASSNSHNFGVALATTLLPAVAATLFIVLAIWFLHHASRFTGKASVSATRLTEFRSIWAVLVFVCGLWLITIGGILFGTYALSNGTNQASSVAEGSIYIAIVMMLILFNLAIIAPGLLMLQPVTLWKLRRAEKKAVTPRQKFRALYPRSYNPSVTLASAMLGVVFACTFSALFPLIGPPVVILLFLTLVAHRYLTGYVYGRVGVGQNGGLLHIWVIRRFATLLALQPLLLGLVLLSLRMWGLSAILLGTGLLIVVVVEGYAFRRTRLPGYKSLDTGSKEALDRFKAASRVRNRPNGDEEGTGLVTPISPGPNRRRRPSMSSMLDMISMTLGSTPVNQPRGPLPLDTEHIDDMISTERAARTKPGGPPQITYKDRAEETAGLMYPPELLAPTPVIWLPNDPNGVGRSEANDLQHYHGLQVALDVADEAHDIRRGRSQDD